MTERAVIHAGLSIGLCVELSVRSCSRNTTNDAQLLVVALSDVGIPVSEIARSVAQGAGIVDLFEKVQITVENLSALGAADRNRAGRVTSINHVAIP